MKKHNEGYALAFVLVVMVVLCLVAVAILNTSLNNLRNEQAMIDRMQNKYDAQGEIEKVIARLEANIQKPVGTTSQIMGFGQKMIEDACTPNVAAGVLEYYWNNASDLEKENDYLSFSFTTQAFGTTAVSCTIHITGNIELTELGDDGTVKYNITNPKWNYEAYTITQGGGGDET